MYFELLAATRVIDEIHALIDDGALSDFLSASLNTDSNKKEKKKNRHNKTQNTKCRQLS